MPEEWGTKQLSLWSVR